MLPQAGLIIPLYVVLARYHQVNVLSGVIITYMTFVLPFSSGRSAASSSASRRSSRKRRWSTATAASARSCSILLPLIAPGLVATSVFAFITCWNEYIFARVLLNDQSKQTLTVWLSYFLGSSKHTDWGALMAGVDADRDSGRRLLPARAAQDLVRADRGSRARMIASSSRSHRACVLPSFAGATAPDWIRSFLAGGGAGVMLFATNVPSGATELAELAAALHAELR